MSKVTKKLAALLLCLICVCGMSLTSLAASPNEQALSFLKDDFLPESYQDILYPQIEKIINQLELTQDQVDQVKSIINATKSKIGDQGHSLHMYSESDRDYIMTKIDEIADIVGVTYTLQKKTTNVVHEEDYVMIVYKNGVKIGTIDGDVTIAKTGTDSNYMVWILVASACVLIVAAIYMKKSFSTRK